MKGLGTDHVISGPMRGLKKTVSDGANKQTNRQTDGHRNSMTESAQWGRFSEQFRSKSVVRFCNLASKLHKNRRALKTISCAICKNI